MKKKKLTSLLAVSLATAMLLSGCGNGGNSNDGSSSSQPSSSTPQSSENGGGAADSGSSNEGGDVTPEAGELTYAEGTVLRMATGYNSKNTGITFDGATLGEKTDDAGNVTEAAGSITLADGNTYNAGDLKPTWVEVQNVLGIQFEDQCHLDKY